MSKQARHKMATAAFHQLGDISRNDPDLCIVGQEDAENYYGNWVEGFGFINVRFPKATTRDLTEAERARYHGMRLIIGHTSVGRLEIE